MSYYLHDIPGRLRIKTPAVKNNPKAADDIKNLLATLRGVNSMEFNLTTGSILIYYHPDKLHQGSIIDLLCDKGYFDQSKAVTNDQVIKSAAEGTIRFLNKSIVSDLLFALI
jgi:hypothetical protein